MFGVFFPTEITSISVHNTVHIMFSDNTYFQIGPNIISMRFIMFYLLYMFHICRPPMWQLRSSSFLLFVVFPVSTFIHCVAPIGHGVMSFVPSPCIRILYQCPILYLISFYSFNLGWLSPYFEIHHLSRRNIQRHSFTHLPIIGNDYRRSKTYVCEKKCRID